MADPKQEHPHFDQHHFWGIVGAAARNVASVLVAVGILWMGLWTYVIQPQADTYIESKLDGLRQDLGSIATKLTEIQDRLPEPLPLVEFRGGGHFIENRTYKPGNVIPFLYMVRRNDDCPTNVLVRFWEARTNSIATEYSYTVEAQRATPSFEFQPFSVRVRLPLDMRSGHYAYIPVLQPDRSLCPGRRDIYVEPSDFFEVAGNE